MKNLLLLFSLFTLPFSYAFGQSWLWGKQAKGSDEGEGYSVATNAKGECYLTGYFNDTLIFGSQLLISNYNNSRHTEGFLVKYDNQGNLLWAIQTYPYSATGGNVYSFSVTADNKGNSYLTGYFGDTIKFGSFTIGCPSNQNVFVAKIDSNSNVLWLKQAGKNYHTVGLATAVDNSSNVLITGVFEDTAIFGSTTLYTITGSSDLFVTKYDSVGNVIWAKQAIVNSSKSGGTGYGITIDHGNNIFITGVFSDTISITTNKLIAASNSHDIFLAKYDSSGNVKWAKQAINQPSFIDNFGYSVVTDKIGNPIITGVFQDTIYFDTNKLFSSNADIYLTKYDSSGKALWAKSAVVLDNHTWSGYSLAEDDSSHIYLTGGSMVNTGNSKIQFGSLTLSCHSISGHYSCAAVVLEFDSLGNTLYGSIIPGGGDDNNGIAVDLTGRYIYYGDDMYDTTLVFGMDTLSSSNGETPFVARWKGDDSTTMSIKSMVNNLAIDIFPNPFNSSCNIVMPGFTSGSLPEFTIYDIEGRQMNVNIQHDKSSYILNRNGLKTGLYILSIRYNELVYHKKLIIIN